MRYFFYVFGFVLLILGGIYFANKKFFPSRIGQPIDSFNNVIVYYNGSMNHVAGRNVINGYNIGLKYQCVEFVKRYYYQYFHHKMLNPSGNAIDFYDRNIVDGAFNSNRGLLQFSNPSNTKPAVHDLIVFKGNYFLYIMSRCHCIFSFLILN